MTGEESSFYSAYDKAPALETQVGTAAYYSDKLAGRKTASGQPYDPRAFTAAHRKLPFDTVVRVVRLDDGRHVYVRITDRGPFGERRRIVDLSKIAAERLDMLRSGVVDVRLEVVRWGDGRNR